MEGTIQTFALLGSYVPRRCGIGTFTKDLRDALASEGQRETLLLAMDDRPEGYEYPEEVRFEMFTSEPGDHETPSHILPQVLERVIDLASQLGSEGREGKPVGALFVVGDAEKCLSLSRQLMLNPFKGYPADERNILDPALEETIKELSSLDGAFIIQGDGTVETSRRGVHHPRRRDS